MASSSNTPSDKQSAQEAKCLDTWILLYSTLMMHE